VVFRALPDRPRGPNKSTKHQLNVKLIIHNNKYDNSILNEIRDKRKNKNRPTKKPSGQNLRMWEGKKDVLQNSSGIQMQK